MESDKPGVSKIFTGTVAIILYHRVTLSRALVLPFLMLLITKYLATSQLNDYIWVPLFFVELAIVTIFAVTIHRIVLLGAESVPKWGLRRWTLRETYFAANCLVLGVVGFIFLYAATKFLGIFGVLIGAYLVARLSLVFPGLAIDQGVTLKKSWTWTRKHQLLMFFVIVFIPFLFYGVAAVLLVTLGSIGPIYSKVRFAMPVFELISTVLLTSALSVAYQEIVRIELGT